MSIQIPEFLEKKLAEDHTYRAAVDSTIVDFNDWLSVSKLTFFPDYTDHGIDHLNQVLDTATNLMTKDAKDLFTAADAGALILAVLLHDSALHLSKSGFKQLIYGEAKSLKIPRLDVTDWDILWNDFLFSAKRWDDRKLRDVFGVGADGEVITTVRDPFDHYDDLKETDRKLIGEFIRWFHPRLAHQFTVYGVPGASSEFIKPAKDLSDAIRDLVGLIARSHGMSLRTCIDYLGKRKSRNYNGIHPVYLMTLLRVADYLQIESDRAGNLTFDYKYIYSEVSQQEIKAHKAIDGGVYYDTEDDPEAIFIDAKPNDVKTFLRLKQWLAGIQEELDSSWAVLGETYGPVYLRQPENNRKQFGLILRRVRSNLDHIQDFADTVDYVPEKIGFDVARADMLKLLVGPLYDNQPSIGIRELTQNAVDAVRERWALEEKNSDLKNRIQEQLISQEHDVEIWIDDPDENGIRWLTVSDKGVGMTLDVIRDYFLTVGTSFRSSETWKRNFEDDETQKSKVLRSGRFGVGVLAAFLLGDRIEVSTHNINSEDGYEFATTIELDTLEIIKDKKLPFGTTIRIPLSKDTYGLLNRDFTYSSNIPMNHKWYQFAKPTVEVLYGAHQQKSESQYDTIDTNVFKQTSIWRRLRDNPFDYDVYWCYRNSVPGLTVNGIFIRDRLRYNHGISIQNSYLRYSQPQIIIHDANAQFPLNLRRDSIIEYKLPFMQQLKLDIINDYFAYLIVNCPQQGSNTFPRGSSPIGSGSTFDLFSFKPASSIIMNPTGIIVNNAYKNILSPLCILVNPHKTHLNLEISKNILLYDIHLGDSDYYRHELNIINADSSKFHHLMLWDSFVGTSLPWMPDPYIEGRSAIWGLLGRRLLKGCRVLIPSTKVDELTSPDRWFADLSQHIKHQEHVRRTEQVIQAICDNVTIEQQVGNYTLVTTGDCDATDLNLDLIASLPANDKFYAVEIFPDENSFDESFEEDLIAQRWREVIRHPVIPYNPTEREQNLQHAYKELAPFIAVHKYMKENGIQA